eukprot:CAMPEP_0197574898 /NCGR_PEP_ID=MMETSP1326-20131121/478_1 /TAXON_ID=1155430 /ORGANISM="Genus nov. species nov., Strain RCC2288" /LENGTH=220 /DNA_ID=CAMNT_0043137561 /DNA_START=44 /DNA_END=706 /DNA_ORIENTATION=-
MSAVAFSLSTSVRVNNVRVTSARRTPASKAARVSHVTRAAGDIIESAKAAGFNTLVMAIEKAGLTAALKDPSASYTVFAPTDAAFAKLRSMPEGEDLQNILKYHVCKGKVMSRHITNFPTIMTLEGTKVAIDSKTKKADKIIIVGCPPQGTQGLAGDVEGGDIIQVDIECSNGVIHVIDGVMIPKPPLVGQNGGYVAGTVPGSGEGRTGLDTKVSTSGKY